ncbi:aminoglycoside phosphotransferase family protein [endosymbiont of unidentified scaly snail isolate Monju]|uniref:aminoglycoside phosphotransferase family protein n=1 Tax=endosymbiont of unidentified scaly snail isolate Monju TaxID=1248727 RepID=UPI0005BA77CD|nr:phosphotransferase [endosymbiont of unidentified scaly snail isolate Monju]
MPGREAQMHHWLEGRCGLFGFSLVAASSDASFRRYFRLLLPDGETRIVMDAPPAHEDCRPFVEVNQRLEAAGVHVPRIHAQDLERGFLLLEDLGDRFYLGELDEASADRLYGEAIDTLLCIQRADASGLPDYDRALLAREMALFPDWLLDVHLGLDLAPAERRMLDTVFEHLIDNALAQPRVLVHRDYHSRNLLVCDANSPGVIDHQDAVLGPVTYDLVSLLRDCYIAWPHERVAGWLDDYAAAAVAAGVLDEAQRARLPEWFDLMGVQRHLKAAGIFARLYHRDGKSGYLGDIPRTLGYILAVAERHPPVAPLAGFLERRVMPALQAA